MADLKQKYRDDVVRMTREAKEREIGPAYTFARAALQILEDFGWEVIEPLKTQGANGMTALVRYSWKDAGESHFVTGQFHLGTRKGYSLDRMPEVITMNRQIGIESLRKRSLAVIPVAWVDMKHMDKGWQDGPVDVILCHYKEG